MELEPRRGEKERETSRIVEVVRLMAETFDLGKLFAAVENAARGLLACEQAQILVYDSSSEEFYRKLPYALGGEALLTDAQARNVPGEEGREFRISARTGPSGQAALAGEVIRVKPALGSEESAQDALAVPLTTPDGELMGVLHALGRPRQGFTPEDLEHAQDLGALAAIALKRQLLINDAEEKHRLEGEMEMAREISLGTLPTAPPSLPGYDVAGWVRPAHRIGGDCYDYRPLEEHRLAILVADATGHGLDAALVVAKCRAYLRALLGLERSLEAVGRQVNRLLWEDLKGERFVTLCFGVLDAEAHRLEYLSPGQAPIFRYRARSGLVECLGPTSPPVGLAEDLELSSVQSVRFEPGDLFLVFTDGLFEWRNHRGEQYGEVRLAQAISQCHGLSCAQLIRRVYEDAHRFGKGSPARDDIAALVVKRQA